MTHNNTSGITLRDYQQELLNNTRVAFRDGHKRPLVVLPCGGGKTVCFAEMAYLHNTKNTTNNVWFLVHRRELIKQTVDTFRNFGIPMDNIFVGMVQTISRNPGKYDRPTLIIFDEAHHAKAKSWRNIIDYFEGVPMVGLTATPERLDGKPLGDIFDQLVEGVSSKWLIDNKYLSDYDYYAPPVNYMEFKFRGMDFDLDYFTAEFLKSKVYGDIEKYIDPKRKTIIYASSVEFSKLLCERIPGAVHFDGNTPTKQRDDIIRRFKSGEIRILSNVDLIGEGFDVPDCDCVILLRPTLSLSLFIQQSMRCLRYKEGKRAVIYDLVGNVYRHGLPTNEFEWSLTGKRKRVNKAGEPDIIVRRCEKCLLVYPGLDKVCPYCGHDNGKTRKQMEEDNKIELEKIEKLERKRKRMEEGRCQTYDSLYNLAVSRGYKNPRGWARIRLNSRRRTV